MWDLTKRIALVRNIVLFSGGMLFLAHELFPFRVNERPTSLIVISWMLGAPFVLPKGKSDDDGHTG